jgi:hypothetical protein
MPYHFKKHYTRDEARALLPQIRQWLKQMSKLQAEVRKYEERMSGLMAPGADLGGALVNTWARTTIELDAAFAQFQQREIQVKDLDRGLIDFPAIVGGNEVFLCWEQDEEDIEFWHDLEAGYAGRERL